MSSTLSRCRVFSSTVLAKPRGDAPADLQAQLLLQRRVVGRPKTCRKTPPRPTCSTLPICCSPRRRHGDDRNRVTGRSGFHRPPDRACVDFLSGCSASLAVQVPLKAPRVCRRERCVKNVCSSRRLLYPPQLRLVMLKLSHFR